MNVLVTGIAGFLGSHCAARLSEVGHNVYGVDDLSGGTRENVPSGSTFMKSDICDAKFVSAFIEDASIEAIVHCAAFASENLSHNCRLHTYRSIVQGSATLVNAAVNHGVKYFCSMSSIAVYGDQPAPFREDDPALPADAYGVAKLCMEGDLKAAHSYFGLNYTIFRPHNIVGTRQSLADSTRNVASIFIRQALSGRPLTVFGDGLQTRAFSPVSKVAGIIAASVDRPETWNNTYNVGGDKIMYVLDLAEMVSRLCGVPLRVEHLPERKETKHACSIHAKVGKAFGDIGGHETIEQCLTEMIAEARKNPLPELKSLPRIEIQKLLNPAWLR